jgi:hypothetical protein
MINRLNRDKKTTRDLFSRRKTQEKETFDGLENVVLELIYWDKQEWFPKTEELPWFGLKS